MRLERILANERSVPRQLSLPVTLFCLLWIIVLVCLIWRASSAAAQDDEIVTSKAHAPLPPFDSLDEFSRNYFPKAVYEEARTQTDFDVLEIAYSSAGGRKWPAIIFNRGGTGDYSRIVDDGVTPCGRTNPACLTIVDLYQFAKAGFVVVASDYRFHGATAKRDEWGGST